MILDGLNKGGMGAIGWRIGFPSELECASFGARRVAVSGLVGPKSSIGAAFRAFLAWEARGCWVLRVFCGLSSQRNEEPAGILFRRWRKSHLAPCMALGLRRRRAVLAETPPTSPVRAGRGFDSRELQQQMQTPPDETGWRLHLWWWNTEPNPRPLSKSDSNVWALRARIQRSGRIGSKQRDVFDQTRPASLSFDLIIRIVCPRVRRTTPRPICAGNAHHANLSCHPGNCSIRRFPADSERDSMTTCFHSQADH